jgi:hypothetical protein
MRRHLLWLFAVLSLVLCMALALLWARSYWVNDGFAYARAGSVALGRSHAGRIAVMTRDNLVDSRGLEHFRWANPLNWESSPLLPGAFTFTIFEHKNFLGFAYARGTQNYPVFPNRNYVRFQWSRVPFRLFVVPYWFGAALLAWPLEILIVRALIRFRRNMSRAPGTCRHCGYDLRATPDRCPECGRTAGTETATTMKADQCK